MTMPLTPARFRSLAWLALPLVVAVLLAASRRAGGGREPGLVADLMGSSPEAADPLFAELNRRLHLKQAIANAVRSERRSLFLAAAQFRTLNEVPPSPSWKLFGESHPAASDEERYCRQVISWVEAMLLTEKEADDGTVARLRGELEEALRRGPLTLPAHKDRFLTKGVIEGPPRSTAR